MDEWGLRVRCAAGDALGGILKLEEHLGTWLLAQVPGEFSHKAQVPPRSSRCRSEM